MKIPEGVDFSDYIKLVGELEAQEIHSAGYWRDKLTKRVRDGVTVYGDTMPWSRTHDKIRFREGEMTIWAGMNGHFKTAFTGMVLCHLAKERNIAIASLEMYPEETMFRMVCQSPGCKDPSEEYANKWVDWADERIVIYDQLDKVSSENILGFIHYCASELNCKHIVIDSLTKCGIASDDRNGEKDLIDRFQWAAKTLGCHLHIIAHVRKPPSGGEEYIPSKFDVRGAGELVDLTDNLIILWKDKKRAKLREKLEFGYPLEMKEQEYYDNSCDQLAIVAKQRHGRFEGALRFYIHESLQFTQVEGKKIVMVDL